MPGERLSHYNTISKRKRLLAATTALSLGVQNLAFAASCPLPAGGFVVGRDLPNPANFSENVFTGTAGSLFIPDSSVHEHNDPAQPLTGGGHNWVFDQGSTLCKVTDVGPAGQVAAGWEIPPNSPTDCVILPIIKGGRVTNLGDIPYQGQVITPTCVPSRLSTAGHPNPANDALNQLGCSISHGVATTAHTATSWLFVAGIKGGLFSVRLDNVPTAVKGAEAGKTAGPQDYFSAIPEGQKLTSGAVSPDGMFAMATSNKRETVVFACLHPLGDPGDPSRPINPNFFVPQASQVKCMQVGSNFLQTDLTTFFGGDDQPYFGGQRVVNSFDSDPGGVYPSAWPNCIWKNNGSLSLADAFAKNRQNGCGNAVPNFAFTSALITQPQAFATHVAANGDKYVYISPVGGTVDQFKLTKNLDGTTRYQYRTYLTGVSIVTGLGVADDLKSLIVMGDPTAIGLAAQEVMTKVPLCEDIK
jgi:hypothetical protein